MMIAIKEKKEIKFYSKVPRSLGRVSDTSAYSIEELRSFGYEIYLDATPNLPSGKIKSETVTLDEETYTFTFDFKDYPETVAELATRKRKEFDAFSHRCQLLFREKKDYYELRGLPLPKTYEETRSQGVENEARINSIIDDMEKAGDKEALKGLSASSEAALAFYESVLAV